MSATRKHTKKVPPPSDQSAQFLGRYLRKFTLQNVRTFRSPVTLDFCHPDGQVAQWTVILGENGTGKTTLLQYLAGMAPMQDESIRQVPVLDGNDKPQPPPFRPLVASEDWLHWHAHNLPRPWAKPMRLRAELEVSKPVPALSEARTAEYKTPFKLELTFDSTKDGRPHIQCTFNGSHKLEFYEQFRLFGYGASRHMAGQTSPYLTGTSFDQNGGTLPFNTLFNDDVPLISPEQWLLGLHHSAQIDSDYREAADKTFKRACRCLQASLPGIEDLQVKPYGIFAGQSRMMLVCRVPYSHHPVAFASLSIGYRTMAAWLTDFIKRMYEAFPNLDEPDDGPAIVLIDEFDLHMHPKWQREAMTALSKEFPNTQFIVTAHSPLVVQAAEGHAKLIVLRRFQREDNTEEVLVDDHPRYAAGWRVDQILSSDLYGMDPRSATYDALMKENILLRQKDSLTPKEKRRLDEIEVQLDREAPPGTSSASKQLFADLEKALQEVHSKKE